MQRFLCRFELFLRWIKVTSSWQQLLRSSRRRGGELSMEVDACARKESRIDIVWCWLNQIVTACKHWDDVCVLDFDIISRGASQSSSLSGGAACGRGRRPRESRPSERAKGLFVPKTRLTALRMVCSSPGRNDESKSQKLSQSQGKEQARSKQGTSKEQARNKQGTKQSRAEPYPHARCFLALQLMLSDMR